MLKAGVPGPAVKMKMSSEGISATDQALVCGETPPVSIPAPVSTVPKELPANLLKYQVSGSLMVIIAIVIVSVSVSSIVSVIVSIIVLLDVSSYE